MVKLSRKDWATIISTLAAVITTILSASYSHNTNAVVAAKAVAEAVD